jgi:hypothetical protein
MANDRTKWVWTNETGSADFPRDCLPPLPTDSRESSDATHPVGSDHVMARTSDGERTSIYRPKPIEHESGEREGDKPRDFPEQSDPVTGWLVVVKGPGLGTCVNLGIGANPIGRDRSQRVRLDHGDTMISRANHATIVYDDRARAFFIQHGDGKNLTRVNDNLVTGFVQLHAGDTIELGPTTSVRFVPFCGLHFCWADVV